MSSQEAVSKLYRYRDFFFENHPSELANKKTELLALELEKVLNLIAEEKKESETLKKVELDLLKAKSLNVLPEFSTEAHEILTKLVKFHPKLVDAWNELGICFWKKKDIKAAKSCFESALREEKNAESLRNLSMILRQLGTTPEEKLAKIQESLSKAKEAVDMNIEDGKSWYILGNAYLSLYFGYNQNPQLLKESQTAYSSALQDSAVRCNPDLYYNWAMALKCDENYKSTLEKLEKAIQYDPLWTEPKEELESLVNHLENIQLMITKKGKLKPKKIREMINSFNKDLENHKRNETFIDSKGHPENFQLTKFSELEVGFNNGKIWRGKVACHVYCANSLSFTFCMLDEEENCFAVSVYNLAQGKGVIIGDSVAILNPFVKHFNFTFRNKSYTFSSVRVNSPLQMEVNKKRLGRETLAMPQLSVTLKSD